MALRRGSAQTTDVFGEKLKDLCLQGSSSGSAPWLCAMALRSSPTSLASIWTAACRAPAVALRPGSAQITDVFGEKLNVRGLQVSSSGKDYQALELMFVGQAALGAALVALVALALTLSRTLGLSSPALELVLSSAQVCQVLIQTVALVALEALEALALMISSTLGLRSKWFDHRGQVQCS